MSWSRLIKFIAITVLSFNLLGASAGALGLDDLNSIYKDTVWYDGSSATNRPPLDCGTDLIGSDNAERAWNYFIGKGLSPIQAAAILGNFNQESGINPKRVQGGGESETVPLDGVTGYGIAQWTDLGRQQNLDKFAKEQGRPVYTLDLQLDFTYKEMTDNSPDDVWDTLITKNDIDAATRYFHDSFERSADDEAGIQERINDAKGFLAKYGSGGGGGGGSPCDGGIGTSPDGFVFPLKTTQAKMKQGVDGAVWCYESTSNCHHDYNAADIHAETGTPVLAVHDGVIKNIRSGPARLVLLADNNRTYYYTHMDAGSITVSDGADVEAGQIIGAVGTNADAEGTVRHLHIDELPTDQYDYRPGCGNAECQAYPFIDIQPELLASFKNLP